MSEEPAGVVRFYAQLNGTEPVVTGEYEFYSDEVGEQTIEQFIDNTACDWAYEAVHSDNLRYWAELVNE